MKKLFKQSGPLWIIGLIILAVMGVVIAKSNSAKTVSTKTNRELALGCTTDMATQFHIHPTLEIDINGKPAEIPAQIGIQATCMNAIHTHDASGVLHVEAPEKRDFTLADFFAVWGKSFDKDQILDSKVDATHVIRMTDNGMESQEYENLVLRDGHKIVIYYEEKKL